MLEKGKSSAFIFETGHSRHGHQRSTVHQNEDEAFLIHIWKSQVFIRLHERDLTLFKTLLRNCFAQVVFSLSVILKMRIISASTSWAQSTSQATVPYTLPIPAKSIFRWGFWISLFYRTKSSWFCFFLFCFAFLSTLCATEQALKKHTHLHSKIVFLSGWVFIPISSNDCFCCAGLFFDTCLLCLLRC